MPRKADPSGLERLWAPWRMAYIDAGAGSSRRRAAGRKRRPEPAPCLFCVVGGRRTDKADLVIARRPNAMLMLNRFPYNPAHLMVAPRRHVAEFRALEAGEGTDVLDLLALAERILAAEYRPDGVNYGANVGTIAGAGFPGHLHVHLVPRWNGDTNFMPVIGATKVLPESLERTWLRLRRAARVPEPDKSPRGRKR